MAILIGDDSGNILVGSEMRPTRIYGNGGNDTLYGERRQRPVCSAASASDLLFGGAGSDRLFGGAGNDMLVGGLGRDFLSGGAGSGCLPLRRQGRG